MDAPGAVELARSLLYLSYLFPPRGGAGVQRSLKFAKYLPEFGWKPLIVANGGPASGAISQIRDDTLLPDPPRDTLLRHPQRATQIGHKIPPRPHPTHT